MQDIFLCGYPFAPVATLSVPHSLGAVTGFDRTESVQGAPTSDLFLRNWVAGWKIAGVFTMSAAPPAAAAATGGAGGRARPPAIPLVSTLQNAPVNLLVLREDGQRLLFDILDDVS